MLWKGRMKQVVGSYVLEFQAEPSRFKGVRYHWMISSARNPDVLVSWGYASTQELAEIEARNEIKDLEQGVTKGGRRVNKPNHVTLHRY